MCQLQILALSSRCCAAANEACQCNSMSAPTAYMAQLHSATTYCLFAASLTHHTHTLDAGHLLLHATGTRAVQQMQPTHILYIPPAYLFELLPSAGGRCSSKVAQVLLHARYCLHIRCTAGLNPCCTAREQPVSARNNHRAASKLHLIHVAACTDQPVLLLLLLLPLLLPCLPTLRALRCCLPIH
jgi:hypothetical protein